jgi:hypothetical protein
MIDLNFLPINNSWMIGFIRSQFPHIGLKDYYLNNLTIINRLDYSLVYVDDEIFDNAADFEKFVAMFDPNKDILLCKSLNWCEKLRKHNFTVIETPYFHILDDCIALRKINKAMPIKQDNNVSFFCLNRNGTYPRYLTVKTLEKYDFINNGYVTYNAVNGQNTLDIANVKTTNDLSHYVANGCGFERNNHVIDNTACSSNVVNYFYISNNIPGTINIGIETKITPFFPTEKSFIFAFTKRLPLVIAEKGRISMLREQGFDVFDDVIDHSYDSLDGIQKIEVAIEKNSKVLRSLKLNPFTYRVESNYNYLLNDWCNLKLIELCNNIKQFF